MRPNPSFTLRLRAVLVALALVLGLVAAAPTPAVAAPKAPSGLTRASYSNNAVRLTWKAVKGAAAYQVKYASNSKLKKASYFKTTSPVAEIGGLKAAKNYYFKVRALKANGKALTKYSKTKKIKTRAKKSYSALSPAGLAASNNFGDELTLSWAPQGSSNRYLLRWATKKSMKGAHAAYVADTSWIVEGLTRATPYYFTVAVVNAKNKAISQTSGVYKATTAKLITFGTPTGVEISRVNPTDFTLSWTAVRKAPAYRIAYASDSWDNPTYVSTSATSIKLDGLIANTAYEVKVQAQDAAGQPAGEYSAVAAASTPSQAAALRVASYNVMCHTCSSKGAEPQQPWTVRRDYVAATIQAADPDVVALQEARQSKLTSGSDEDKKLVQFQDLRNRLGSPWALTNTNRYNCANPNSNKCLTAPEPDDSDSSSASTTPQYQGAADDVRIAYRTDRLVLLRSGGVAREGSLLLPARPADNPDWVDPSPRARYLSWAFFQQKSTGKKFLIANVHLEPRNDDDLNTAKNEADAGCGTSVAPTCGNIRLAQAQAAAAKIAELNVEGLPVVMAGDLSSSRAEPGGNLPYTALVSSGLIDPLRLINDAGKPYYTAAQQAPAEVRINIAFNSVNQYERTARRYPDQKNVPYDASTNNSYNGAYNDYILTTPMRVSEFEHVVDVDATGQFVGVIPSDHNLIRASLWLP